MLFLLLTLLLALVTAAPAAWQNPIPFSSLLITPPSASNPDNAAALTKRNIGGVRLSDGANWTGHVWYGIFPLNECISLGDYAHNVLSFRPDDDTECLVMQGECNAEMQYTDLYHNSTHIGDLGYYDFVEELESYMCFAPITLTEGEGGMARFLALSG